MQTWRILCPLDCTQAVHLKRHVQPHLVSVTEQECIKTCRHPPPALDKFKKDMIGNAMLNTELCEEDHNHDAGAVPSDAADKSHKDRQDAQRVALALARARIMVVIQSRANKVKELGAPIDRLRNLQRYLATDICTEHEHSNGRRYVTYRIPIDNVPESLKIHNFSRGKLVHQATIDYEQGRELIAANAQWQDNWACKYMIRRGPREVHFTQVRYRNPDLFGRRTSISGGAMHLPTISA